MISIQKEFYMDNDKVEVLWDQPVEQKYKNEQSEELKALRVAAYCRVSTDLEEQKESFELQEQYYSRLIHNTPGWQLVGIYVDEGITGTQRSRRIGFQRMMRHCEEGKIDRILCKSISRFARNTIDLLDTVRALKELNISVVFEKECIDTLSVQSEFVLSTIAAIAQDESRSISENMMWSFKKRFQRGIPVFRRILGYNIDMQGKEKKVTINQEEAIIVHEIFDLGLEGMGYTAIARIMMQKGYLTAEGRSEWTLDSVKGILINERYTGDALCQKTYTPDYLTHKCKRNSGEYRQYLIENHHPGIISREIFSAVQVLVAKNKTGNTIERNVYPLSGRVICGDCGATYHRYYSSNNASWRCSRSLKNNNLCSTQRIRESQFESTMLKAFQIRYDLKDKNILHKLKIDIKRLQDDDNIERSRVISKRELTQALSKEVHSVNAELETAIDKRILIEEKLKRQEQFWSLIEKDRGYRAKTLAWLDQILISENRMNAFFEQLNIMYMRAWVIGITVLSPISISIQWFDNTKTMINPNDL